MPVISLLIPFRNTGDRQLQFEWLQKRWEKLFPEAEIIISEDDGKDPFSKTIAVNNAYKKATSDILAIVDADVWVDPKILIKAAEDIRNKKAVWVQPCDTVYRINKAMTFNIVDFTPDSPFPLIRPEEHTERITPVVGLVAVFRREQFEYVGGMDPRFRGWGWEDTAFNSMLNRIYGKSTSQNNIVYHLWHPRGRDEKGRPVWEGQTDRNATVGKEYTRAKNNKTLMLKIAEANRKRTGIGGN
jgi:predicted glycosyltransferase involved in capsule biosynthesis